MPPSESLAAMTPDGREPAVVGAAPVSRLWARDAVSAPEASVVSVATRAGTSRPVALASVLVAASIGLSAFLLFALELLVGRLVLPVFGGTPSAWATVLVFFQGILLVGYLYGHLVVSRLSVRSGAVAHAFVVAIAVVALAAWPTQLASIRDESLDPILDLLRVLLLAVGIPAFVLTTTTPLLSSWYARIRGARDGGDPFWLYAVSNGASFAALAAYPLVVERAWGLATQRLLWEAAFVVLAGGLVLMAVVVAGPTGRRRASGTTRGSTRVDASDAAAVADAARTAPDGAALGIAPDDRTAAADAVTARTAPDDAAVLFAPDDRDVTARRRLAWILVAAVPSALLSAVTNLVATDLVSAPLLWMGPLSIYLLSFVIAFSRRGRRVVPAALALTPVAVTLLWIPLGSVGLWPALPLLGIAFVGYAVVATGLNGVLALDRPSARHLTEFYLCLAVGGVLGGAFVGVFAPMAFPGIWEYPLLLVATLAAVVWGAPLATAGSRGPDDGGTPARRRGLDFGPFFRGAPTRLVPYGIAAALVMIAIVPLGGTATEAVLRWVAVGAVLLLVGGIPRFFVVSTAVLLIVVTFITPGPALFQGRSFFGVSRVVERVDGARVLLSGTTIHGLQATDPALAQEPTAYYVRNGPAGDLFAAARARSGDAPLDVGIAGLGTGGLVTYARSGDAITYYEIDPVVIAVASDPALFTYLEQAPSPPGIVEGDARLSLVKVADGTHDMLIVDAFSSDTPPTHLLTVEAIADAMRTVRPGGVLALHLSNRYYDLIPAVAGAGRQLGLAVLRRDYEPSPVDREQLFAAPSAWVVLARAPADLAKLAERGWVASETVDPVTDDRPDILRLLRPLW